MPEGNETSDGESGPGPPGAGIGPEGRSRRGEGDLLAERRARRAAESGELALARRAEAAEATVRTLEAHVASLQQRLREVDEEGRRVSELIAAERLSPASGLRSELPDPAAAESSGILERELRRVRQREYAEQRLRVEAEERLIDLERDGRAELERLGRRLSESEAEARTLAARLEDVRRQLAETEQSVAAERTALGRAEAELRARIAELEARVGELQRELDRERAARERAERTLEIVRLGHRKVEALLEDLKGVVPRLKEAAEAPPPAMAVPARGEGPERRAQLAPQLRSAGARVPDGEMADALAAAVERLRARVAEGAETRAQASTMPPRHKHSYSLIGRWRIARKQRRVR